MQKLENIDPSQSGRTVPMITERERQNQQQARQEKEELYQQLVELCNLGESEAAKQLARRYERWRYEIIDGEVVEKKENSENG